MDVVGFEGEVDPTTGDIQIGGEEIIEEANTNQDFLPEIPMMVCF